MVYYNPNEEERIKKTLELMEAQNQIKQSLWDEINTPDVLKLKEKSKVLRDDYYNIDKELRREVLIYNRNTSIYNSDYISLNIGFCGDIDPNLPNNLQELILLSREKWNEYESADEIYMNALHKSIANLSLAVTPENCIKKSSFVGTRWVFSEFYESCKPFLILDVGACEIIIIQDLLQNKFQHTKYSITMSDLKRVLDQDIEFKNQKFYNNFSKELDKYRGNLRPKYIYKSSTQKQVCKPFEDIYTLFAQTESEEYGRTRRYLIIGCVTYQR